MDTMEQFKRRLKGWLFECALLAEGVSDSNWLKARLIQGLTSLLTGVSEADKITLNRKKWKRMTGLNGPHWQWALMNQSIKQPFYSLTSRFLHKPNIVTVTSGWSWCKHWTLTIQCLIHDGGCRRLGRVHSGHVPPPPPPASTPILVC